MPAICNPQSAICNLPFVSSWTRALRVRILAVAFRKCRPAVHRPGETALGKAFLAMVWVVVPALFGAFVGAIAGGIAAGIVVAAILGLNGPDADAMAVTIGCVAAATITLVGAIAGAAAA